MDFLELMQAFEEKVIPSTQVTKTRGLFANVEQLDEAGTAYSPSTGNLTITVIKPGWSKNNRYYSAALLKGATNIFEGAKMFCDHQTEKDAVARPEGSVRDWVGTITGIKAESDGTVKATANIHNEAFKTNLTNLKKAGNLPQMGVSIRAFGEAVDGEAEGRKGKIIESLLGCKSVDFVTYAAAGGKVEAMSEAVDPNDLDLMDLATLRARRPDLVKALKGKKPKATITESETQRPIRKFNGAVDNGHAPITESDNTPKDIFAGGDKVMLKAMVARGEITKEQSRFLRGKKSKECREALRDFTKEQKKEFDDAVMLGFNESDALKLAKLNVTIFREVSR